jgi:hypothetical protein
MYCTSVMTRLSFSLGELTDAVNAEVQHQAWILGKTRHVTSVLPDEFWDSVLKQTLNWMLGARIAQWV